MKRLSLRFKMLVFVVLITGVSLIIVGISNYSSAKQRIMDTLKENAYDKVQSRSYNLSAWIGNRLAEVEIMSRTEQVRFGSNEQRLEYFRKEVGRSKGIYSSIGFADLNGDMVLSSGEKINIRSEATFSKVMRGMNAISDPFTGKATKQQLITLQVPVYGANDELIGLVNSAILTDTAFSRFTDFQVGSSDTITVAAADGTVYYRHDTAQAGSVHREEQSLHIKEIAKERFQAEHGYRELAGGKDPQVLFFSAIEGTPWYLVLQVSIGELEKPLNSLLWKTVLSITAAEAVMLWLLILIYNRQIVRVRAILSVTETVAGGNFNLPPIPISNHDEIGAMAQSVNGMMAHLKVMFDRLDTIINHNDFAMMALDADYTVTYFSKTAESMLGYTAEEVLHKATLLLFIAPEEVAAEADRLTKLLGRTVTPDLAVLRELRGLKYSYEREWTFVRKDGTRIPVAHNSNGLRDQDGRFIGVVAIARDITEQERIRQELVKAKLEAEEANLAKSRFLARMSHEIRTPLNGIIGLTRLMQKTGMTDIQKDYSSKVLYSSEALLRIINDILDFSKVEAGKLELERIVFHPEELMNKLSGVLSVFLGGKEQFELMIETDDSMPDALIGDPLRLEQVLLNLCNNAVKFTDKGYVKVKASVAGQQEGAVMLRFTVEDTGIGISKEQLDRLFKPFTQADGSTSRKYGGTGLGLVIASSLISMMEGSLEVESEPGQGSIFSFTVPMLLAPGAKRKEWKAKLQKDGLRVLVVEDHTVMQQHVSALLRSFSLEPVVVSTWKEAFALVRNPSSVKPCDLALMDMEMPDMYGIETWAAFKQDAQALGILTLALTTAYGRDEMAGLPIELRPDGIVVKPVSRSGLFQSIDAALDRSSLSDDAEPHAAVEKISVPEPVNGSRKKILLAEDHEINQQVAQELLSERGYYIGVAQTGYEVLDKLQTEAWDLVLMDIHMPELDGVETTRRIRSGGRLAGIPIIALTANVISHDHEQYLAAGMNDIITKPIDLNAMDTTIRKWLHETAVSSDEDLNTGSASSASFLPQLSGDPNINVSKALARLLGREPIFLKMMGIFVRDYTGYSMRIREALERGDNQDAQRFAHTLKGAAGSLAAEPLYEAAARLEESLKAANQPGDHTSRTGLDEALEHLEQRLEELIATLKKIS
ncbi:MAG: multi-sensor hybrid histidine kinase [Paenibacillus sp.]|jgi:two-component system sensor histidine kinase/response regulator|nr:multi-sensor hybrid histidine kinase [Paenibacillus sp.]